MRSALANPILWFFKTALNLFETNEVFSNVTSPYPRILEASKPILARREELARGLTVSGFRSAATPSLSVAEREESSIVASSMLCGHNERMPSDQEQSQRGNGQHTPCRLVPVPDATPVK